MKIFAIAFLSLMSFLIHAQTMQWIPVRAGMNMGTCTIEKSKKQNLICYTLEYTPGVSGVLTSYTTGFFISCTSLGPPVAKNISCTMTSNVNQINGCAENGIVLVNSSGNSGNSTNSFVHAGVPINLHQVCFSIPYGDSVIIREDPVTDLTTSIDLINEDIVTEYPSFTETVIYRKRPDISKPILQDFKATKAGDFTAQLDWTTHEGADNKFFEIQRSDDGKEFLTIGRIETTPASGPINSYQFFDKEALRGINYYRLRHLDPEGNFINSPVRVLSFSDTPFAVNVTPNPADQFIFVEVQSPDTVSSIKLLELTGRVVLEETAGSNFLKARLETGKLNPGVYRVIVESGSHKFTGNVVIVH